MEDTDDIITSKPCSSERMELIDNCTDEAAEILDISADLTPGEIVRIVDDCVYAMQKGKADPFPEDAERHLSLGCLWGAQLVAEFDWQWRDVDCQGESPWKSVGVVSPRGDMAIYPFDFTQACLDGDAVVTIMLAFNMLKEETDEHDYADDAHVSIMRLIHHLVPRD